MSDRLYTDHPELYDAIQSGWDYDRDVAFVEDALDDHGVTGHRLLEVGCGTGEHTRRFVDRGFDVTAVDPYGGMLDVAREKCGADFRQAGLPDLAVEDGDSGTFDVAVAIRGVVNHLPPGDLEPALDTLANHLVDGGLLVFDSSPLPPDGNRPGLDVGSTEAGRYVRVAQMQSDGDGRLDWVSVVFTGGREVFANSRKMTPFADETIATALTGLGFDVETRDGFGPDDRRTVFVAVR